MTATTMNLAQPHADVPTRERRDSKPTLHLGTFADGQRAVPVMVTYSATIGSFGGVEQG
jgi:hypothetical protein